MTNKSLFFFFWIAFQVWAFEVSGQIPQVPSQLNFADLTIQISPQAMREIQLDVDAQHRNPSYFKTKQERVNLYMPIIERVLEENGVPVDFKYLVIQESALIADAVSTSNAVGFWQFKQGTAEEVFLRVDSQIDERKNIVSSTRGAALYLKKHNKTFDNWMAALVSYQMGLGGAKAYFGTSQHSKKTIEVDRNTYWYFKKFLAHKIAFEGQTSYLTSNKTLVEVPIQGPATLAELAKKYAVSEEHLFEYNKWTKDGKIPGDRTYSVLFVKEGNYAITPPTTPKPPVTAQEESKSTPSESTSFPAPTPEKQTNSFPKISGNSTEATSRNKILVNGLSGILSPQKISISQFAKQIKMKESRFRKLNEIEDGDFVLAGAYYYTEKKNASAELPFHTVKAGETLWSISQKYGILLSSLKSKNRIRKDAELKPGMILNLQEPRKRGEKIKTVSTQAQVQTPKNNESSSPEVNTPPAPTAQPKPELKNQETPKSTQVTHTVNQGETLFAISRKYGVTIDQLKSWNGIGRDNIISIGQKLTIFKP